MLEVGVVSKDIFKAKPRTMKGERELEKLRQCYVFDDYSEEAQDRQELLDRLGAILVGRNSADADGEDGVPEMVEFDDHDSW